MGFSQLKHKVEQAEQALEANERIVGADWRVFKRTWREAWTPGRVVVAGLLSGFLVGKAEPLSKARASGVINLVTALGGLFASGSAAGAAQDAKSAAQRVENEAAGVPEDGVVRARVQDVPNVDEDHMRVATHDSLRRAGLF